MADTIKKVKVQGEELPVEDTYAREQIISLASEIDDLSIPKKTSELTNDSGFITASSIPSVPTNVSELTNDSGFITASALPKGLSYFNNDANYATTGSLPTKLSQLTNDAGFITASEVPEIDLTNYYKKSETYSASEIDDKISAGGGGGSADLSNYYKKTETYSQTEINQKFSDLVDDLDTEATDSEVQEVLGKEE